MAKHTVIGRVRLADMKAREEASLVDKNWDYKDRAAFFAVRIYAILNGDPKALRLAMNLGINPDCPRHTLDVLSKL